MIMIERYLYVVHGRSMILLLIRALCYGMCTDIGYLFVENIFLVICYFLRPAIDISYLYPSLSILKDISWSNVPHFFAHIMKKTGTLDQNVE